MTSSTTKTPEERAKEAAQKQKESDLAFAEWNKDISHRARKSFPTDWEGPSKSPDPEPDPNPGPGKKGTYSSVKDASVLLKPGRHYRYYSDYVLAVDVGYENKAITFSCEIREYIGNSTNKNHKKSVPVTDSDWNKHAERLGKSLITLPAEFNTKEVMLCFPTGQHGNEFLTGIGGNKGSGTLAHAEKTIASALAEALKKGVAINTSDPGFQNFMQAVLDKRGSHAQAQIQVQIIRVNKNSEQHKLVEGLDNTKAMQEHVSELAKADKLPDKGVENTRKEIDDAIAEQRQKVKNLTQEITDLTVKEAVALAGPDKDALSKEIVEKTRQHDDVQVVRLDELEKMKVQLDVELKKPDLDREGLERVKDKLAAAKNPDQPYIDAVNEVKAAIPTDLKNYANKADQDEVKAIKDTFDELHAKFGKDLSNTERTALEVQLKDAMAQLKAIPCSDKSEQDKLQAAIAKADKDIAKDATVNSKAVKRVEAQIDKLKKAAAELCGVLEKIKEIDPTALEPGKDKNGEYDGMIIGKEPKGRWGQKGNFERIKKGEGQKYIDKKLNNPAFTDMRNSLQEALANQKKKLDDADKSKMSPDEQKKITESLAEVEGQLQKIANLKQEIEKKKAATPAAPAPGSKKGHD